MTKDLAKRFMVTVYIHVMQDQVANIKRVKFVANYIVNMSFIILYCINETDSETKDLKNLS